MIRVKICGITSREDALTAARLGADAIGVVNVTGSKRYVSLAQAKKILEAVPVFTSKVIVTTPGNLRDIKAIEETGADMIQLHGEESQGFVKEIRENTGLGLIKQIPVTGPESCDYANEFIDYVDALLLDTKTAGVLGGTGKTHDWNVSRAIAGSIKKPVILAGGLSPENVGEAIDKVRPYAVDVASGVEKVPGIKDGEKIGKFILNAKSI
ncbi:MAG: phosphoribosylanthranilate isomerase [Candidatus Altiarchaeota archaeon]|nr:phosphoribosylanthranilate isomerase [Candidatus Altiarchaeota archaeon]